jgi:putative membrane protein
MSAVPSNAKNKVEATQPQAKFLSGLVACFVLLWILSVISPVEMGVWILENVLVVITLGILIATYRRFRLSKASYLMIAIFLLMHEVGAHYTYEQVPFGFWIRPLFGFTRNNYDRIVHFAFGFLFAFPFYEMLGYFLKGPRWSRYVCSVMFVLGLSAFYEIDEAYANFVLHPYIASAYLSLQGDPIDSQNDMATGLLGGILAIPMIRCLEGSHTASDSATESQYPSRRDS